MGLADRRVSFVSLATRKVAHAEWHAWLERRKRRARHTWNSTSGVFPSRSVRQFDILRRLEPTLHIGIAKEGLHRNNGLPNAKWLHNMCMRGALNPSSLRFVADSRAFIAT
jgi:hypothetical protein